MDFGSVLLGLKHGGRYRRSTWVEKHDPLYISLVDNFWSEKRMVTARFNNRVKVYCPLSEDMLATDWVGYPGEGDKNDRIKNISVASKRAA